MPVLVYNGDGLFFAEVVMPWFVALGWIAAYTICLINIGLFTAAWVRYRERGFLGFILILADMALMTAMIMTAAAAGIEAALGQLLVLNALTTFGLTVPLFIHWVQRWKLHWGRWLFGWLLSLVLVNGLIYFHLAALAFTLSWFPPLIIGIITGIQNRHLQSPPRQRPFPHLAQAGGLTGLTAGVLGGLFQLLYQTIPGLSQDRWFTDWYFAGFTAIYQVPGLIFSLSLLVRPTPNAALQTEGLLLSPREREVAEKIYAGLKYEAIATELFISLPAVKKHVYNIYRKNGLNNNRQLIQRMISPKNQSFS